jgi:hypothetical protein
MRDHHRQLLRYLKARGLKPRLKPGKKHMRIEWMVGNRTYFITCAISPSDQRAVLNARAEIRRQLKGVAGFQWPVVLCRKKSRRRS